MPFSTSSGARYYVRLRVPVDLRGRLYKRELVRSLGTASPSVARRRLIRATQGALDWFTETLPAGRKELQAAIRADLARGATERFGSEQKRAPV